MQKYAKLSIGLTAVGLGTSGLIGFAPIAWEYKDYGVAISLVVILLGVGFVVWWYCSEDEVANTSFITLATNAKAGKISANRNEVCGGLLGLGDGAEVKDITAEDNRQYRPGLNDEDKSRFRK